MIALDAIRSINFDWTLQLKSVWSDNIPHVPELNQQIRDDIIQKVEDTANDENASNPLGKVMIGLPGSGKTHLLGSIRREVWNKKQWFVLVDMTDVRDFEETVLLGFIDSLQMPVPDGRLQYEMILEALFQKAGIENVTLKQLAKLSENKLIDTTDKIINRLRRISRNDIRNHQDVIRALIYFHSKNYTLSDLAYSYLFCFVSDDTAYTNYNFLRPLPRYIEIVKSLSWIMSVGGVTLLALDQLDAIVTQQHLASGTGEDTFLSDEQRKARSIIEGIGRGLSALRDQTSKTLIAVSCLPRTWEILKEKALSADTDRYESPVYLQDISQQNIAEKIIEQRLQQAYQKKGFTPEYPTWPFKPEAFHAFSGTPRDLLKQCDKHRREWIQKSKVWEIDSLEESKPDSGSISKTDTNKLDEQFKQLVNTIQINDLLDENKEDEKLGVILQTAFQYLIQEFPDYDPIDTVVDCDFPSSKHYPPLHARIRIVFREESDREEHYCARAMLRSNASSYRARLKAAMASSGIDRDLSFRCLRLYRDKNTPSGKVTQQMTKDFLEHNGKFITPQENELKTIAALQKLQEANPDGFFKWLQEKKPVSQLDFMKDTVDWYIQKTPAKEEQTKYSIETKTSATEQPQPQKSFTKATEHSQENTKPNLDASPMRQIPVGRRLVASQADEDIYLDLISFTKHTVILAGTGSGKTVLIKRLIEEASLVGIPCIVIDAANDLSRLGEPWPHPDKSLNEEDQQKADHYFSQTEHIVWTPGRESGNPLHLSPLPDFSPAKNDSDELSQLIMLARDGLAEIVASGSSVTAQKKSGVLSAALKFFAHHTCGSFDDFIELLTDLPVDAGGGITHAEKFALEMADQLRAAKETNPLLQSSSEPLEPSTLLFTKNNKTRLSIINFIGLQGQKNQQEFLNQLAMTLFTWIKKNPASPEKPLQGLFVIDEAKDFIPAGNQKTPCKDSLIRLAAQARKYGLGLIFATQAPKSIDHNIIANCGNQFYGQANSPAAIDTIEDQIKQRGGSGHDVSKLGTGNFYVFSERINGEPTKAPIKIKTPLCLSHHPNSPLDEKDILQKALQSRNVFY